MQIRITNTSRCQAKIFQFALDNHHLEGISSCNCEDTDAENLKGHQILLMDPRCYRAIDAIITTLYIEKVAKDFNAHRISDQRYGFLNKTANRLRREITEHIEYLEDYAEWRIERD